MYDYWYENHEVLLATNYLVKECKVCAGYHAFNPYEDESKVNDKKLKSIKQKVPWNPVF